MILGAPIFTVNSQQRFSDESAEGKGATCYIAPVYRDTRCPRASRSNASWGRPVLPLLCQLRTAVTTLRIEIQNWLESTGAFRS